MKVGATDGRRSAFVAAQDGNGRCVVFDAATGETLAENEPEPGDALRDLAILPNEPPTLALLHRDNRISLRAPFDPSETREITPVGESEVEAFAINVGTPDTLLASGEDGTVAFVDLASGAEILPRVQCHTTYFDLAVDPNQTPGKFCFVTTSSRPPAKTVMWRVDATTQERIDLEVVHHDSESPWPSAVFHVAFVDHESRQLIVGVGSHSQIHLWDAADGSLQHVSRLEAAHHMSLNAISVGTIAGQTYVLTGGHTCTLGFWSIDNHKEHHLWVGSQLWSIEILPNDMVVAAGARGIMAVQLGSRMPGGKGLWTAASPSDERY